MKVNINLTGFKKIRKSKSNNVVNITKFINLLSKQGKKNKSLNLLLNALVVLKIKLKISPFKYMFNVFQKIKPLVELKSLKVGSTRYLVPTPLPLSRQLFLGLKILIKNSKNRPERNILAFKLASEILEFNNKRGETHKQLTTFFNLVKDNIQNAKFTKFNSFPKSK